MLLKLPPRCHWLPCHARHLILRKSRPFCCNRSDDEATSSTAATCASGLDAFAKDLSMRGLIAHVFPDMPTNSDFKPLAALPRVVYAGFDPTADSLHVGNLLILCGLLRARLFNCQAIGLVGGATALVGDPSGHNTDRSSMIRETVESNCLKIMEQLREIGINMGHFTDTNCGEQKELIVVNNMDWYAQVHLDYSSFNLKMSAIDFLRMAKPFRIGEMMRLAPVKSRMLVGGLGMAYPEFSYQILQAYDWWQLLSRHECAVQLGGSDQFGHFDAGYHYIQKQMERPVFGICLPLVTDDFGNKLGKSTIEGNTNVWLSAEKTSSYMFYQYWRQLSDTLAERIFLLFTLRSFNEAQALIVEHRDHLGDWILQKALADEMTMLVHGTEGLHLAQRCSRALFEGTLESFAGLGQATIEQLIGKAAIFDLKWDSTLTLGALANRTRTDRILGSSLMTKGAFKMNGERLIDPSMRLPEQMTDICLPGTRLTLICWGKRKYSLVRWC